MKQFTLVILMTSALVWPSSAQAQLFSRESLGGAAVGGLIGGIVGHNNGRKSAEGAAIGAGAGLLLGTVARSARNDYYGSYGASAPVSPAPVYVQQSRPNYAVTGTVLGGIAGGVIGHNNGRKTAEGIAIGAGAGLLLGGLAEHEARQQARYAAASQGYVVQQQPAPVYVTAPVATAAAVETAQPQPQPAQQVTVINNYYGSSSSMGGANSLFGR